MKKYWVDNECMIDFIEIYCEGKSFYGDASLVGERLLSNLMETCAGELTLYQRKYIRKH